jgi:hypothetical protein
VTTLSLRIDARKSSTIPVPAQRSRCEITRAIRFRREQKIKNFAALLLPPLGFDEAGIAVYRSAALSAFRAALPTN